MAPPDTRLLAWLKREIASGHTPSPEDVREAANFTIAGGTYRICEALIVLAKQAAERRIA